MSRRGCDGGRKKGVIDSRRGVIDCDVSGRIDYTTMMSWSRRNNLENIFGSKIQLDRFRNWVICFQSLFGPTNVNLERKRSQSVQRFIPG